MCNYAIFDCLWHKYITRVLCFGGFQSWQNSLELRQPLRQLPKKQAMASADPGHLRQHRGQSWPRDTPAGAPVWLRGFSTKDTHGQPHGCTHAFQRGTVMSLLSTGGVGTVQLCPSVPAGLPVPDPSPAPSAAKGPVPFLGPSWGCFSILPAWLASLSESRNLELNSR